MDFGDIDMWWIIITSLAITFFAWVLSFIDRCKHKRRIADNIRRNIDSVRFKGKIMRRVGRETLYSCVADIAILEEENSFSYRLFEKELQSLKREAYDKLRILKKTEDLA